MSIGIGAILFLVSLGYGLQKTILEKITTADSLLTLDVSSSVDSEKKLNDALLERIKNEQGAEEVVTAANYSTRVKIGDVTSDLTAVVTSPSYFALSGMKITDGVNMGEEADGIVVSSHLAQIVGSEAKDLVGQELDFTYFGPQEQDEGNDSEPIVSELAEDQSKYQIEKKFKVIGVVTEENNNVYMDKNTVADLNFKKDYNLIKIKCRSDRDIAPIRDTYSNDGYIVSSLSETVDQLNKVFQVVKILLMLFGIIALVVSAIGMFNTMTIALLERTEEIGIMKSIGASDFTIYAIFLMESTIMGFLGGIFGIVIGWLEGNVFNWLVNMIATHFGGEKVGLFYSPTWFILLILGFSAVVGMLTGVMPARRASRIDPLEALRYK
jgi:ABC-type antimicrobial peptide transport system permease subunit